MASPCHRLLSATLFLALAPATASAAPTWSAAADAPATSASEHAVAFDGSGNATAAWIQAEGSGTSLYTARRSAGAAGFTTAARVTAAQSSGGATAEAPQLAVDSAGNAILAWVAETPIGGTDTVTISTRAGAAGTWTAPQIISNSSQQALHPTVGFAATGSAVVAFDQAVSSSNLVIPIVGVSTATGSTTPLQTLSASGADATTPHVAFNAKGAGVLVWTENTASFSPPYVGKSVLRGATRAAGLSTFGAGSQIYLNTSDKSVANVVGDAAATIDASGTTGVAFATVGSADGAPLAVAVSSRTVTATGWTGLYLSRTGASQPRIASSAQGGIVAAYVQGATDGSLSSTGTVRAGRLAPGATDFTAAVDLSASGAAATAPSLAAGTGGTTVATWISRPGGGDTVQAAVLAPSTATWTAPTNLDGSGGTTANTGVAVDASNTTLSVWGRTGKTSRAAVLDGATVGSTTPATPATPPATSPSATTPATTPASPDVGTATAAGSGAAATATTPATAAPSPAVATPTTPKLPMPTPTPAAPNAAPSSAAASAMSAAGPVPSLTVFKALSPRRFRAAPSGESLASSGTGLRLAITTNVPGTLRLVVTKVPKGGKATNLKPVLSAALRSGITALVFTGRVGGAPLPAGRYRLKATFIEAAGHRSNQRALTIAISR